MNTAAREKSKQRVTRSPSYICVASVAALSAALLLLWYFVTVRSSSAILAKERDDPHHNVTARNSVQRCTSYPVQAHVSQRQHYHECRYKIISYIIYHIISYFYAYVRNATFPIKALRFLCRQTSLQNVAWESTLQSDSFTFMENLRNLQESILVLTISSTGQTALPPSEGRPALGSCHRDNRQRGLPSTAFPLCLSDKACQNERGKELSDLGGGVVL